jgi:hypothetical protein
MRLREYLDSIGISANQFALSTGLAREIVVRVSEGKGCTARTAERIILATHGAVTLADITGSAQREAAAAARLGKTLGPAAERGL